MYPSSLRHSKLRYRLREYQTSATASDSFDVAPTALVCCRNSGSSDFAVGGLPGAVVADIAADHIGTGMADKVATKLGSKSKEALAQDSLANKQALEDLMLNPQRLSDALKAAEKNKAVVDGIKENLQSKVAGKQKLGGLLGALGAAQAYKGLNN